MPEFLDKIDVVETGMTFEDKVEQGICLGKYLNEKIKESDADIGIMLCDDDELYPTYLRDLSVYFEEHSEVLSCYSDIYLYNPLYQESSEVDNLMNKYNQWRLPIDPTNKVDATQVAWRLSCCKEHGAWFEDSTISVPGMPWVKDTDKSFYENLFEKCGEAHYSGLISEYKGTHEYQLLWHKKTDEQGLREYDNMIRDLAGKVL